MHEMGRMKRAQEQQVEECSVLKLRESHETIQQLTSRLQQMQEQMNSMIDSGDFQDIESNYFGRLSHVSNQPARIPSSRSLLSLDERLPLDAWNQEYRWTCSQNNFLRLIHLKIFLKEFRLNRCTEIEKLFLDIQKWRQIWQVKMDKFKAQFQCWCLLQSRWLRVLKDLLIPQKLCGRTAKTTNIGAAIRQVPWSTVIYDLENDSKHRSQVVLIFHRMLCCGSKKWRRMILRMS